jgi:hypothetical protein
MSTLNVANISDDQSTLTGDSDNLKDNLHDNKTVDTKYVTNGAAKAYIRCSTSYNITASLNISSATNHEDGDYSYSITHAYASKADVVQTAAAFAGLGNTRWVTINSNRTDENTLSATTRNSDATLINTGQSATSHGDLA